MNIRILLVEDEEHLQNVIGMNLELEGYKVYKSSTGADGIKQFRGGRFDLVILDVMLPEMDGFTVCKTIRLENKQVPILFLTAKGSGSDRIEGLKIGADDYLVKPFNLEELLLRVKNLLKRTHLDTNVAVEDIQEVKIGAAHANFKTFEILTVDGVKTTLSKREMFLLKLLIERKGEVVSREEILETIWGYEVYPSTRTIDNYILAFRKYFEPQPKEPKYFHSVRGVGYKFVG
ncbi:MAG: two-component system alkaline phosphatase synthesis response regulator PhoP [Flavobacteriales bacterium]|jgi:two-component system alkaline phosphatase synthesis response regulator PhoP